VRELLAQEKESQQLDETAVPSSLTTSPWPSRIPRQSGLPPRATRQAHGALIGVELRSADGGDTVGDFDILYVTRGRLYAGECKAGSRVNEKDVQLARLSYDLGVAAFTLLPCATSTSSPPR
jgi:hypothetical protein